MAISIMSDKELERNRFAFQKRLKVVIREEATILEKVMDAQIRERFFKGERLPYEIAVAVPEGIQAGANREIFQDENNYAKTIIPIIRRKYGTAGWSSVVKREPGKMKFILGRKEKT